MAAAPGMTSVRSILEKPLHELTEDDISQITREDCRRYLKEKGMRRPSWNKSQAIQQVICLKSLLEPSLKSSSAATAAPTPKGSPPLPENLPTRLSAPNCATSNSPNSVKEQSPTGAGAPLLASTDDGGLLRGAHLSNSDPSGELECGQVTVDSKAVSLRNVDVTDMPAGQMTIFYSGKVNVYDGVSAEKAQAIMHLAASPFPFSEDDPVEGNSARWVIPDHLTTANVSFNVVTPDATISPATRAGKIKGYVQSFRQEVNMLHDQDMEGHANRQVSLQRYLEKRKDRGRFKSRKRVGSSSGLEMYWNHQLTGRFIDGQQSWSSTSSQTQTCVIVEKQSKSTDVSVDHKDKV